MVAHIRAVWYYHVTMKIAGFIHESIVDGPGIRSVIFTQGCRHKCRGCHNPETWDENGGIEMPILAILDEIKKNCLFTKAVTISGGDPFYQADKLLALVVALKEANYHICVYTGFLFEELVANPLYRAVLPYIDLLIDGPYRENERTLNLKFRGSANQHIIDVPASLKTHRTVLSSLNN